MLVKEKHSEATKQLEILKQQNEVIKYAERSTTIEAKLR